MPPLASRARRSDSYTPVAVDIGMHLVAGASYMDRTEYEDNPSDDTMTLVAGFIRFENTCAVQADCARD